MKVLATMILALGVLFAAGAQAAPRFNEGAIATSVAATSSLEQKVWYRRYYGGYGFYRPYYGYYRPYYGYYRPYYGYYRPYWYHRYGY